MKCPLTENAGARRASIRQWTLATFALALLASVLPLRADPDNDNRRPVVPPILEPPADQKVLFHAFAVGVQIYTCTATATNPAVFVWTFKAPEAVLFKKGKKKLDEKHAVGLHYAGPTWEFKDESKVVGRVLQRSDSPDPNAIPWLLLEAASHDGKGKFDDVTFIQRVNTKGGKAPTTGADAAHAGQEVRVPYTADYYFYRETQRGHRN